jgi:hypothetical protein
MARRRAATQRPRRMSAVIRINELSRGRFAREMTFSMAAQPVASSSYYDGRSISKPFAAIIIRPAAVEFDVPSRLSAQESNGHPSTACGGRWPGLSPGHDGNRSPGHDGNGESRSTAPGIRTAAAPRTAWIRKSPDAGADRRRRVVTLRRWRPPRRGRC